MKKVELRSFFSKIQINFWSKNSNFVQRNFSNSMGNLGSYLGYFSISFEKITFDLNLDFDSKSRREKLFCGIFSREASNTDYDDG